MPFSSRSRSMLAFGCAGALALVLAVGCATVKKPTPVSSLTPAQLGPPADWEYQIQVGDQLAIKFYFNPDLTEEVTVRPDGRISLQLVPEVVAAGRTARELTSDLKKAYAGQLSNPELTVIVKTFSAQRIFVGGEVDKPGEKPLVGTITALQAVATAGGFKYTGRETEVIVIRRGPQGRPIVIPLNLKAAISGVDPSQDLRLMPYDVVYVPRSTLAITNKFVDQFIRQHLPVSFGFRIDITP